MTDPMIDHAQTTTDLYLSRGGRVSCGKLGCIGSSAFAALAADPTANLVETSLDAWVRATEGDNDAWREVMDGADLACETCGETFRTAADAGKDA